MSTTPQNDQLAVFPTVREAVPVEPRHRALKVPIYSRFLLVAMGLLAVGIPMGFVSELLWGTSP